MSVYVIFTAIFTVIFTIVVEPDEAQNNDNLQTPCMLAIIS